MRTTKSLLLSVAVAGLMISGAQAADLLQPAAASYSSQLFDFEGFYVGVTGGGALTSSLYGTLGFVAGSNFALTDGIIGGVEFQSDMYFNGGIGAYDVLGLGRVGGFVSDNTMAYAELGAGFTNTSAVYALGGGLEMAMSDQISVRGEVQALGAFGAMPSVGKANIGLLWHMN